VLAWIVPPVLYFPFMFALIAMGMPLPGLYIWRDFFRPLLGRFNFTFQTTRLINGRV